MKHPTKRDKVPIANQDLLDRLIDDVLEHTFADMPRLHGGLGEPPEQPELGIDNHSELREQMTETIRKWVKEIFRE
jgi:L-alanine-DL-glutamate epimerase-like enolase superfamily enzyme